MRKVIIFAAVSLILFSYSAHSTQLYWFSASAVKKPSQKIAKMFNKTHSDKVVVISGGTGQILQQMILSKKGDIYGCLDPKFFKMAQKKGLVESYIKFIKLVPVFGISKEAEQKIHSFNDIFKKGVRIAAGNPKTMALGKTYLYILNRLPENLRQKLKNNVKIEAINISQIVNYIKMNSVDAGLIFAAVAKINDIKYVSIPKQYNKIKTGYLTEIKFGNNQKAKDKLFNFILKHLNIYKQYGYQILVK